MYSKVVFLLPLFLLFVANDSTAQILGDSIGNNGRLKYFVYGSTGVLIGSNGGAASASLSIVNGVKVREKTRIGFGVGVDLYDPYTVAPLFITASRDFTRKNKTFFGELSVGKAIARSPKDFSIPGQNVLGGIMLNPAIGYAISAGNLRVAFTLGYRFQRVLTQYVTPEINPLSSYMPPRYENRMEHDFRRLSFGMRIGFR